MCTFKYYAKRATQKCSRFCWPRPLLNFPTLPTSLPLWLSSKICRVPPFCTWPEWRHFFGEGPYLMNRGIDVSRKLTYTPLTIGRQGEYYINVQSIKINNKVVPLNTSLLPYSPKRGVGGTMISTTTPYTILQTSIFRAVTQLLINQLQGVPQVKPMAPFGVCFDAKKFASNKAALTVSSIDLVLDNNRNIWRLYGHNVIVQPSPNVACLGFVDGGLRPQASIVIGALQLEDNLLQFDLTNSRLGFSSSLLSRRTSCSNFNFGKSSTGAEESTESTDEP
nr:gamma conglutin 1-like [Malus domestica]